MLLELGRPADAIDAFQQALARNANRSLSVLGMARASAAIGQTDRARDAYATLLANYEHADADLPEIAEALAAREGTSTVAVNRGVPAAGWRSPSRSRRSFVWVSWIAGASGRRPAEEAGVKAKGKRRKAGIAG